MTSPDPQDSHHYHDIPIGDSMVTSKRLKSETSEQSKRNEEVVTNSRSAFERIPNEVLELIWLKIGTVQEVVKLASVCKQWNHVVQKMQFLYRYMDLGPLLINNIERLKTFHSIIKNRLGLEDCASALRLVFIGPEPSYTFQNYSQEDSYSSVLLSRRLNESMDTDLHQNCLTIVDLDKAPLRHFARASQDSGVLPALWDELTHEERTSYKWRDGRGRYPSAEIGAETKAVFVVSNLPLSHFNMRTILSQLCRNHLLRLYQNVNFNLLVLYYLSSEENPVQDLRIEDNRRNFAELTYAENLQSDSGLTLGSVIRLELQGTRLNPPEGPEHSYPQIIAPHLRELRIKASGADLVLLRSAAGTLRILELPERHSSNDHVLKAVLQLTNLEVLWIDQPLLHFCKALSTCQPSGQFPCPRLQQVTLHDRSHDCYKETYPIRTYLRKLVHAFCRRMRLVPLSKEPCKRDLQATTATTCLRTLNTSQYGRRWRKDEWGESILLFLVLFRQFHTNVLAWAKDQATRDFFEEKYKSLIAGREIKDYFREV